MLNREQRDILRHTAWRAVNRMYCGSREDPDILALINAGLMRYVGSPSFLPESDGYYTVTGAWRKALETPDA